MANVAVDFEEYAMDEDLLAILQSVSYSFKQQTDNRNGRPGCLRLASPTLLWLLVLMTEMLRDPALDLRHRRRHQTGRLRPPLRLPQKRRLARLRSRRSPRTCSVCVEVL